MRRVFEYAHGIDKPVAAFFRNHKRQIFIVFQHGQIIPGVIRRYSRVAALHRLEYFIHDFALKYASCGGVRHQFIRLLNFRFIRGIERIAQTEQRFSQRVSGIVNQQYASGIASVIQGLPACNRAVGHCRIIDNAQRPPRVRHCVTVFRIIGQIAETRINQGKIRNIVIIERRKHIFFNQLSDHII